MRTINFITTNSCNANCSFCFEQHKRDFKAVAISNEVVDKTLEYFFNLWGNTDIISIDLFGGEPTLAEDTCVYTVNRATEMAREYRISLRFLLFTNCFVFPEKLVEVLLESKALVTIQISNEGVDNHLKDHNNTTLREKIHSNIERYVATKLPVIVRATMSSESLTTAENLLESVKLMVSLGLDSFYFFPIMEHGWQEHHFKVWRDGFHLIADYLFELHSKSPEIPFNVGNFLHEVTEEIPPMCAAGEDYVSVNTDGEVYACQRFLPIATNTPQSMGSVFTGVDLKLIGEIGAHEGCRECRVKNCKICPAVSYVAQDDRIVIGRGDYCRIRLIMWDEYMYYTEKMQSIGQYNLPTSEQLEELDLVQYIETMFYKLFNVPNQDAESGYNIYNTRTSYMTNIIRYFLRMSRVFIDLTEGELGLDTSLTDESQILTYLIKFIESILFEIYNTNPQVTYIYHDNATSLTSLSAMLVLLLEEKGQRYDRNNI